MRCGIQKARIEDITHACGLSKGAFYLHFESKEALFRELVKEMEARFEKVRAARESAYGELLSRGLPRKGDPAPFITALTELDGFADRALLELLWEWRDVTDVLLRGAQGTEFESVLWLMLDREVKRVEGECVHLQRAGLLRADLPTSAFGPMVVGTYLMVARRMSMLEEKPDIDSLVHTLQSVLADGADSSHVRAHRDAAARGAAAPQRARRASPVSAPAKLRKFE